MSEETKPHMVKQTITFSDGTETVINYRGKIVNGELIPDVVPDEVVEPEIIETVELPEVEETKEEVSPSEESQPVSE